MRILLGYKQAIVSEPGTDRHMQAHDSGMKLVRQGDGHDDELAAGCRSQQANRGAPSVPCLRGTAVSVGAPVLRQPRPPL